MLLAVNKQYSNIFNHNLFQNVFVMAATIIIIILILIMVVGEVHIGAIADLDLDRGKSFKNYVLEVGLQKHVLTITENAGVN